VSDSFAEALEHSEQSLAVAIAPYDRNSANCAKGCALVLLRQTQEGAKVLEEERRRCLVDGSLGTLVVTDHALGVCRVLQGNIRHGIWFIEKAILKREKEGYQRAADWTRMMLSELYLAIISGNERPPLLTLLKNLPMLLKVTVTAPSRIRELTTRVLENPHFDPSGFHVGHVQMILGLLYKTKKKRALALQHLGEARRILSQFGQTPMLARVDAALEELGQ
jgi:hypothetical protein